MKFKFGAEAKEALTVSTGVSYNSLVSEPVSTRTYSNTPGLFSLTSNKRRIIKPRGSIYLFLGRKISIKSICKKVFGY